MITRLESKKARWLNKYRQDIDLAPFFQRGTVWNKGKQQYFMDSILKGWGTPKLFIWDSGNDSYACLDGKQRLTSLFNFMADQLPLGSHYSIEYPAKKYSELPRPIQDKIDDYEFAIEFVADANQEEVVDLYRRLQGGTPLNFGERLFATPSKMNVLIKNDLAKRKFFQKTIALPNTRYAHYAVGAQLCLLSIKGASEDLKLKNLEKFFADYANFDVRGPEAAKLKQVLGLLEKAFPGQKEPSLRNRASAVSAFYLLADLSARGNIRGKETAVGKFFHGFTLKLQKEFDKAPDKRDAELLSYQSAVTQGADKIRSIKIRHEILLKRLAEKNTFFYKLIYPTPTPQETFNTLYEQVRLKLNLRSAAEFDSWLIANNVRVHRCRAARGPETIIGHVRHVIHHGEHGNFTKAQLATGTRLLKRILVRTRRRR